MAVQRTTANMWTSVPAQTRHPLITAATHCATDRGQLLINDCSRTGLRACASATKGELTMFFVIELLILAAVVLWLSSYHIEGKHEA